MERRSHDDLLRPCSTTSQDLEAARWLDPLFAHAMLRASSPCDATEVEKILNCPFGAVYEAYRDALPKTTTEEMSRPIAFWEGLPGILDEHRTHILDCLLMPVAVTTCDSVFSVEGAMFTPQQVNLDRTKVATLLQIRANGDVEKVLPTWARAGFHGNVDTLHC